MIKNSKKVLIMISLLLVIALSSGHMVGAETVTQKNGKTVYTVYTRDEFFTEVYNDIMNEDCSILIRMTDENFVKEMSYEMAIRQKNNDFYADSLGYTVGSDGEIDADNLYSNSLNCINEDVDLLDEFGVYNKYGIRKDRMYAALDVDYTLEKKTDGWYWKFYHMEDDEYTSSADYEKMMDKVAVGMRGLDLEYRNDYGRVKAACDWINSNAAYDYELKKYTDYENIVEGSSVCEGYACATDLVLRSIGYVSQVVYAEHLDHALNVALLDGKWYMIDNTWADVAGGYFLYGTSNAADTIELGGDGDGEGSLYKYDLTKLVTEQTPLSTTDYTGTSTSYCLNSWLVDITDENIRATVGDSFAIKQDRLTQVTSSNEAVASIEDGKIVCHKAGRANITRTDGTYISHYFVLVSDKTTLSVNKASYTIKKGNTAIIKSELTNANTSEITYSSSNKKVATVSKSGKITGKGKGTAKITVKLGDILKTITVTVKK